MNSLTEAKDFDKLKIVKNTNHNTRRSAQTKTPTRHMCIYWASSHPPRQSPAYWEICTECSKIGHFRAVCRSKGVRAMNEVEQEAAQDSADENCIDSVNISSVHFNKNQSVITARLKMSAGINNVIVPYKVDTGSEGNIMPLHICKKLFPKIISEQLAARKIKEYIIKNV